MKKKRRKIISREVEGKKNEDKEINRWSNGIFIIGYRNDNER
jgi:hypothetical protein